MALTMQRVTMVICCCCGVRDGSIASAIYSLHIAFLGITLVTTGFLDSAERREQQYLAYQSRNHNVLGDDSYIWTVNAEYVFACVSQGLVLIASILCIVAINQNNKGMLVPFMAVKSLELVWYLFLIASFCYAMAKIGVESLEIITIMVMLVVFAIMVMLVVSDIVCLLCVLSQYQEYRDGRGRLCDQRGTTVIVQQTMPVAAGGFAYGRMQDAPPAYRYPVVTKANVI